MTVKEENSLVAAPITSNVNKPNSPEKNNIRLLLLLASLEILWAPVNYFIVIARDNGLSPAAIGLFRWGGVCAGLFILLLFPAFRVKSRAKMPSLKQITQCLLIGILLTGPSHLMYYTSLGHTGTVEGTVFNATAPLWMAFFAGWLLAETVGPKRWTALILGVFGAYFASVGFQLPSLAHGHQAWNLLYLTGTLFECLGSTLLVKVIRKSSGIGAFAWETMGRTVAMVLFPLLIPTFMPFNFASNAIGLASMGYLIIISGIITFGAWFVIVEKAPLSFMVVTIALQTPVAAVLGHEFLGEKLSTGLFVGAALIFVGLVLAALDSSMKTGGENHIPSEVAAH